MCWAQCASAVGLSLSAALQGSFPHFLVGILTLLVLISSKVMCSGHALSSFTWLFPPLPGNTARLSSSELTRMRALSHTHVCLCACICLYSCICYHSSELTLSLSVSFSVPLSLSLDLSAFVSVSLYIPSSVIMLQSSRRGARARALSLFSLPPLTLSHTRLIWWR